MKLGFEIASILAAIILAPSSGVTQNAAKPPAMPQDEARFIRVLEEARAKYRPVPPDTEDVEGEKLTDARDAKLCALLGTGSVVNWLGKVWYVEENEKHEFRLSVVIANDVTLATGENLESTQAVQKSMIEGGSALAKDVAHLMPGDKIRFSGSFVPFMFLGPDIVSCVYTDATESAEDIAAPIFAFRFTRVEKVNYGPNIALRQKPQKTPFDYIIFTEEQSKSMSENRGGSGNLHSGLSGVSA
jgi:hypothetical protein